MKLCILSCLLFSSLAHANPMFSVKERLRLHLWVFGLEDQQRPEIRTKPKKALPEEVERALRKI